MKYKIGDTVRVKDNLEIDNYYGGLRFIKEMKHIKQINIVEIQNNEYISKEGYCYNDEMLANKLYDVKQINKQYNIIEASNMPNKEFKVIYSNGKQRPTNVYTKTSKNILDKDTNTTIVGYGNLINATFIPVNPKTFLDICKTDSDVKFKVEHKYIKENGYEYIFNKYMTFDEFIDELKKVFRVENEKKILLEGEFYIEGE